MIIVQLHIADLKDLTEMMVSCYTSNNKFARCGLVGVLKPYPHVNRLYSVRVLAQGGHAQDRGCIY